MTGCLNACLALYTLKPLHTYSLLVSISKERFAYTIFVRFHYDWLADSYALHQAEENEMIFLHIFTRILYFVAFIRIKLIEAVIELGNNERKESE